MKKYVNNFNWLFVEKIIRILGGLFITVWISRYLGPDGFGVLSYALAFIGFFSWASHLGLDQILVRELTKFPHKADQILGSAFGLKLMGALLSIILIIIAIESIMQVDELVRGAVGLASLIYIFRAFDVIDFYYQAKVLSKFSTIARNLAFIIVLGLQVYLIVAKYPVLYFVAVTVIDALLAGFFMLYLYRKTGNSIMKWKFNGAMAVELMKYSWPLMIGGFLVSIQMKVDQVMIGSMLNISDVGIYSVAVRLSEFWFFIPTIIASTLMPYFISLKETNYELYRERFYQLFSFMFWLGMIVGGVVFLLGQEAILFLFGESYKNAYGALIFNIWGGIFIAQGLAASIWLISEGMQTYSLYIQMMAVSINIVLNILLIPTLGITGAAISTFLTYFLATWVFGLFFKKLRSITLMMIQASLPHHMYSYLKGRGHE